jgi:hypothetical protein
VGSGGKKSRSGFNQENDGSKTKEDLCIAKGMNLIMQININKGVGSTVNMFVGK